MARYKSPRADRLNLERFGPRIKVEIGLPIHSPLFASSAKFRSTKLDALIDTGAGRTVITPKVLAAVSLKFINMTALARVGGIDDQVPVYVASLQFPTSKANPAPLSKLSPINIMELACCHLPEQPVECLIGRDVLRRWKFTYDGVLGNWLIDEGSVEEWLEPPDGLWS